MKKGLCFNCNKPGHISRFCSDKRRTTSSMTTASTSSPLSYAPNPPKKMNPKEFIAHIRSITAQMGPEEKEEFLDEARKGGFLKRRSASTSTSPILDMYSITAQTMQINSLSIPVQICDTNKTIETLALIDSGAGGKFIDQNYVRKLRIKTQELE